MISTKKVIKNLEKLIDEMEKLNLRKVISVSLSRTNRNIPKVTKANIYLGGKMKKIITVLLLTTIFLGGCTNSQTQQLVEQQNSEVMALQEAKKAILARPTKNAQELLQKKAELKVINDEIKAAQEAQAKAQDIQNQKTNNTIKGVLTGVGAAIGTAATIHQITK